MSFSINVKTISQLPKANKDEITSQDSNNQEKSSLMEVSVYDSNGNFYTSKKVPIPTLFESINDNTADFINNTYGISSEKDNSGNIKGRDIGKEVTDLNKRFTDKINIGATDTNTISSIFFNNNPYVGSYDERKNDNQLVTRSDVSSIVQNQYQTFMFNTNSNVTIYNENLIAKYSDNDVTVNGCVDTLTINQTGNLVLNGWISDNGNIALGNAWVQLQMQRPGINQWIGIQTQPWILGERHKQVQLVSFNLPIATGTTIRVRTGFTLNQSNSGFQLTNNSIAYSTPNCFKATVFH